MEEEWGTEDSLAGEEADMESVDNKKNEKEHNAQKSCELAVDKFGVSGVFQ